MANWGSEILSLLEDLSTKPCAFLLHTQDTKMSRTVDWGLLFAFGFSHYISVLLAPHASPGRQGGRIVPGSNEIRNMAGVTGGIQVIDLAGGIHVTPVGETCGLGR